MKKLILSLLLLVSYSLNAGLPPTASKGSNDSSNVTTFNFQLPNTPATHTGTTVSFPGLYPLPAPSPSGSIPYATGTGYVLGPPPSQYVSQAQLLGQVVITGCNAPFNYTTTSLAPNSNSPTGCVYTTSGAALAPATAIPGIKFSSLAPGSYTLVYQGQASVSGTLGNVAAQFQFWDGTNTANEITAVGNATTSTALNVPGFQHTISYSTPQSNVTFSITGLVTNATDTAQIYGITGAPGVISIYYFPSQTQIVVTPNTSPANWAGTGTITGSTSSGSLTDFGSISGSVTTTNSQNISCTGTASEVGVTCTVPTPGAYLVCSYGYVFQNTSGSYVQTVLTDGSGNPLTGVQTFQATGAGQVSPFGQCTNEVTANTTLAFKWQGNTISGGVATVGANTFSVASLNNSVNAPIIPGNVASNTTGQEHIERASVTSNCTSSPCTISRQSGNWLTSILRVGTGVYDLNFPTGEFSSPPSCVFTSIETGVSGGIASGPNGPTTTSTYEITMYAISTSTAADASFDVICMGPH